MTSQGTPHGRFQRSIQRGQLFHAELAARELGALTLALLLEVVAPSPTLRQESERRAAELLDERAAAA
jgi:hypothetical protein